MNYFVDGDYEISINGQEIKNIYTSTLSNSTRNYKIIELNKDVQKKINYKTFDEIIEYYNQYEIHFEKLLHESGINVWFLEHFRLYFSYRNFFIKLECIKDFLKKQNNNIVVSYDKNLINFIDKSKLQFVKLATKKQISYQRIIKEFIFVFSKLKSLKYPTTKHLILSRIIDDIQGVDKKLGELEQFYDKLMLRNLFDLSEPSSYQNSPSKRIVSSDHILLKYLLNPKCFIDIYKFNKALTKLKRNILNQDKQVNEKYQLVFNLFWKRKMSFFVYYVRFKSFDKYFKKSNLSGILLMDENSPQQKVIQYAASRNGIKVFGIQHGAIHDLHPAYMYRNYLKKPLLPDVTFTWGEHYSELLINKGGFTQSQVRTTGRIPPLFLGNDINPEIVKNKRIIIYATQPQRDPSLRKQQLIDVFTVIN